MARFDVDRHARELERDGYTLLLEVMSPSEIEATKRAIDETLEAEAAIGKRYGLQNENLRMAFNAQGKHPHFYGMLTRNPGPMEVAGRMLGEDCFAHNVVIRVPQPTGKKDHKRFGGNLHADWADFTVRPFAGGKHYPMAIQSAWAVTEFTSQTGGPMIWPGSHLSGEGPPEEPSTLPPGGIVAEAPAGSVYLWDASLWHTGGINHSGQSRYSLIFYYQRWWIKGFNDAYRYVSPQVRAAMTRQERRIWGLEAAVPPNTHFRGMSSEQIAALSEQEKNVLNIAAY